MPLEGNNGEGFGTNGGRICVFCPAVTPTVIKGGPGRLCKVVVTAAGTGAGTIYDNPSAASGNKLLVIPASAPTGTVYDLQLPAVNGLYYDGAANSPAITAGIF